MQQKGYVTQSGYGHVYSRRGYTPLCYQGAGYINPQSTPALRPGLPSRELLIREVSESPFNALPRELVYEIFQQYA
jgi:hypothetical protein